MENETYRGFTIVYQLTPFSVEAIAENNGKRVNGLRSVGQFKADARRRLMNRIDNLLADGGGDGL